jgi:hypothetical protein
VSLPSIAFESFNLFRSHSSSKTASHHSSNLSSSQLAARAGSNFNIMRKVLHLLGLYIDADEGSYTSLFTLASKEFKAEHSGKYFERVAKTGTWWVWESGYAKDMKLAEKLEKWTREEMVKEGWVTAEELRKGGEM